MICYLTNNGRVGFRNIHPILATLITELPEILAPDRLSEEAEERLFPSPTEDPAETDFEGDWKAYVHPDLLQHFKDARDVVESDLRRMKQTDEESYQFEIPLTHADAWMNVLNQARLTLAANHGFTEKDFSSTDPVPVTDERTRIRGMIECYGFILQCLVEEISPTS